MNNSGTAAGGASTAVVKTDEPQNPNVTSGPADPRNTGDVRNKKEEQRETGEPPPMQKHIHFEQKHLKTNFDILGRPGNKN